MTYPVDLERDVPRISWGGGVALATSSRTALQSPQMRSNGLVYDDEGSFGLLQDFDLGNSRHSSVGMHIRGPDFSNDLTAYAVHAVVWTTAVYAQPILFAGISPASPSAAAAGQVIDFPHFLGVGYVDGAYSTLEVSRVVAFRRPGHLNSINYSERALAFGCLFQALPGENPDSAHYRMWMSVQRLNNYSVRRIIDRRIS